MIREIKLSALTNGNNSECMRHKITLEWRNGGTIFRDSAFFNPSEVKEFFIELENEFKKLKDYMENIE